MQGRADDETLSPEAASLVDNLFIGGGHMGALMRAHDWSSTAIGRPDRWPQSLHPALSICVGSRFPIAIYWGPELTLLYNDAWSPILGDKHPWALGRPAREVWPEIWADIGPLFDHVLATGESTYSEDGLLAMHRHGYTEECYFSFTFTPIRGEGGRVEGVFNAVNETTYRVISERRNRTLREMGEALTATLSAAGACAKAIETLSANQHDVPFCLVYLLDEHGGEAQLMASSEGIRKSAAASLTVSLAEPDRQPWPLSTVRASGRTTEISNLGPRVGALPGGPWPEPSEAAIVVPFGIEANALASGFLIVGASPRRAVDEEYSQFAERAAQILARALNNAAAYEAERRRAEELAEIDRAKTAFFSNVSHELRTPLTLILGPTEDALSRPGEGLAGESLVAVHRNALRLLKLVNSVLEFARLESGRNDASFVLTKLGRLTVDLSSAFRAAIERAGLSFHVSCTDVEAFVDASMWERIILNLLSNALKFTFTGSISLTLRSLDGRAVLEVSDTGIGIPPEELPRMFERFHRVMGARARSHEGSGIGLALVSELVKLHGGTVSVTSAVGAGSSFRVEIPLGSAHLPHDHLQTTARPAHAPTSAAYVQEAMRWLPAIGEAPEADSTIGRAAGMARSDFRVLVVDDNADMRDYVTRLLASSWRVSSAANGREALRLIEHHRPDLVLTDVMMPELDGFGLLRALKSHDHTRHIPVIMLSARAGEEARSEGIEAGADDYLAKPFAGRELIARVALHLQLSAQRALLHGERQKLRALFEQAPFALGMFEGPRHHVVLANRKWAELIGREIERGVPVVEALPELLGQPVLALHDRAFAGETIVQEKLPVAFRTQDGQLEERFFHCIYQPLRDEAGVITGHVGMSVEVSNEVRAREELEQARRAAEQANRAKDDFLALLGHELRNPLAPIVTALSLMELRGVAGWDRERAIIDRQVKHLTTLVDDLLDVSRIARGKIELRRVSIELAELVAEAVETVSSLFELRQQEVHVSVPRGLPVSADPQRMKQVISNLLTNAAKYTDPGGRISITGSREGESVCLRVRDTGMGIDAEILPMVFDLFVQERQAIDRSRGGLGLGLSIVRSIVVLHGGTVTAESAGRGQGSTFTICLPAAEQDDAARASMASPRPSRPTAAGARVLIVDDNEDAAELMATTLEHLGYTTHVAHDGPAALRALEQFTPDVALLDIGLPGMDGYELAARLRALLGPRAGIVALTGYGQPEDRRRSKEAGFNAHFVKPVNLDALRKTLASLVA